MTNLWNWRERSEWIRRLSLQKELKRRAMQKNPAIFRQMVQIENDRQELQPLHELLEDWQRADFAALDPGWRKLAGQKVNVSRVAGDDRREPPETTLTGGVASLRPPATLNSETQTIYQRAWVERPRGHSKTSDMSLQLGWILLFGRPDLRGLAAAADADQASLIRDALQRLANWNKDQFAPLDFLKETVRNRETGSKLKIITSDVGSSYGVLPDFIICDELCHWAKPDLWYSLLSSAAKKSDCLLAVLTNAGVGRGWQWEARELAQSSDLWYFSSLDGPQAPWIRDDWLEEQRRMLPDPVFRRLWLNQWQYSDGEFLTLAEVEACRDEFLQPQKSGQPHLSYIAAIDYAEKHDLTVGVLIHWEDGKLFVDRMDARKPTPDSPTRVQWVNDWIANIAGNFPRVTFILDEYQMVGTIQKYESLYDVRRFNFAGGQGNHALAIALRRVILQRQIAWPPGCGQIEDANSRDDLETELASLLLKQSPSGRCRIDHHQDGIHHDDRSFALGAAVLHALEGNAEGEWLNIDHNAGLW